MRDTAVAAPIVIEPLAFETAQFGCAVARLALRGAPSAPELRDAAGAWRERGLYLVSCRLPQDEALRLEPALLAAGFVAVETLVTFERAIDRAVDAPDSQVTPATAADVEACAQIGAEAFVHDRFHADQRLPAERADALKAAWVRNDMNGRADASLVTRDAAGRPTGFVLCLKQEDIAIIDLIAVSPACQGRGLGRALMLGAMRHYAGPGRRIRLGTQAANGASIRLYESLGFAVAARARTYHWLAP